MAIRTTPGIDWSTFPESDGEPVAETFANQLQMTDLFWALPMLFRLQGRAEPTTVGGNQFVYYNPLNGRDNISPDVYVVFGVAVLSPAKWRTWVEGKFPDIVFEITSPTTRHNDLSEAPDGKRTLYARLGAKEYYVYDPQQETQPPFLGFELRGARLEPMPFLASGGIYSPLLGAELRPMPMGQTQVRAAGTWLRVIDPRTNQLIALPEEEHQDLLATRDRLTREARARAEAEERAARAEAALQALLRRQGQGTEQ